MFSEELKHYGVKGMQWGVRHDKKTGDTTIRKGTKINRLSVYDESASKGHAYVTYLKSDTEHYKGFFAARLKRINKQAPVYSIEMEAKQDLVSPSKQKRVETFLELYKNDPAIGKELGKYHKQFSPGPAILPSKFYEIKYSHLKDEKLDTKGYDKFVRAVGGNEYIRSEYFKALSKKGYSFVQDDMDATDGFGKSPSIIFDRQKSTVYKGQTELSNDDIAKTWKREGTHIQGTKKNIKNTAFDTWAKGAWRIKSSKKHNKRSKK